jgi:hypothetical protein
MIFNASRAGESPGYRIEASTVTAAKAKSSKLLEGGCFSGQRITLVEIEIDEIGWHRADNVFYKERGKWIAPN